MSQGESVLLSDFGQVQKALPRGGLPWLGAARNAAFSRLAETGFPTLRNEDWRFTSVEPIMKTPFVLPAAGVARRDLDPTRSALRLFDAHRLVFIDGVHAPRFSSLPLQEGVRVESLAAVLKDDAARVEPYLARAAAPGKAFAALNAAFFGDGACIHIARGVAAAKPIHLLFVSTAPERPAMTHARVLIVAEAGARAAVVEEYASGGGGVALTNMVTEVAMGDDAQIEHYKLQRENAQALHVATLQVRQGRHSRLTAHAIALGGGLTRNDVDVRLEAEGADCALNGLYLLSGSQHVDNHTVIDHLKPHGTSRELYKGVLDGRSRAVFSGRIIVEPDAQKTDAMVYNKNLLLSEEGLVDTKPEFRIHANDVQCKHGATVGQLPSDALFYLRSRGIGPAAARSFLIHAFAGEMLGRLALEPLKEALSELLRGRLLEAA